MLGGVVVVDFGHEVGVEVAPVLEGIVLAVHAGLYAGGYHGGLDGEGARAAHGVDEGLAAVVAGQEEYACGEDFAYGRLGLRLAPAAAVQRLARRVERECDAAPRHMDVDEEVGVLHAHAGAACAVAVVAEPVDHGVLHAVGHILRVAELVAVHRRVDGEGVVDVENRAPVEGLGHGVELVGIAGVEGEEGFEDAQRGAAAHVRLIESGQVAVEAHHAYALLDILGTDALEFAGQYAFQTLESLGHHREYSIHLCQCFPLQN